MRWLLPAAVSAALLLSPAGAAAQGTLRDLNELRADHGIPAGVTENRAWSEGCRLHIRYLVRNEISSGHHPEALHDELTELDGYTPQGDEAAAGSVLSLLAGNDGSIIAGVPWGFSDAGSPYEMSPFDLAAVLNPELASVGIGDGCLRTGGGDTRPRPATPTAFTYPGTGAAVTPELPPAEQFEGDIAAPPQVGRIAGLYDNRTGPGLIAWLSGAAGPVKGSDSRLVGPDGEVELRRIDGDDPDRPATSPANAVILVPAKPLRPRAEYAAGVTLTGADGRPVPVAWRFRTGLRSVASTAELTGVRSAGRRRAILLIRGGNGVGRRARIAFARGRTCRSGEGCITKDLGPRRFKTVTLRSRTRVAIPAGAGQTNITITVPEFRRGDERIEQRTIVSAIVGRR